MGCGYAECGRERVVVGEVVARRCEVGRARLGDNGARLGVEVLQGGVKSQLLPRGGGDREDDDEGRGRRRTWTSWSTLA